MTSKNKIIYRAHRFSHFYKGVKVASQSPSKYGAVVDVPLKLQHYISELCAKTEVISSKTFIDHRSNGAELLFLRRRSYHV